MHVNTLGIILLYIYVQVSAVVYMYTIKIHGINCSIYIMIFRYIYKYKTQQKGSLNKHRQILTSAEICSNKITQNQQNNLIDKIL